MTDTREEQIAALLERPTPVTDVAGAMEEVGQLLVETALLLRLAAKLMRLREET